MSESDNLPTGGTETATSLTLDEAANLDFLDPGEDNEDVEQAQASESETDEADTSQEAEETIAEDDDQAEAEGEEPADKADKPEPKDDVTVTVNGEQVALSDLKAGYMRQADYSRKTMETANARRELEALSSRVNNSVGAIVEFLSKQIPEAPDPSLAMTDPSRYVQQKAMHDAAMAQISDILAPAEQAKAVAKELTDQQRADLLREENAKLAEVFPATSTAEGRKTFFEAAGSAAKELGYSSDEISAVTDHRMFRLAHYAMLGLRAEQAKAQATKKVANKPPVAAPKRPNNAAAPHSAKKKEAMNRLVRSGSIDDAVAAWSGE